jgi:D-alanyl-D-alanine carboxypeptidase
MMFAKTARWLGVLLLSFSLALPAALPAQAVGKFAALVVDARTGAILHNEDGNGTRHPASLTKMMTLYIVFQELKAGRIKLSTPLRVSKRAAAMPPSKLGLKPGSTITVEQAIKALVVKSANDAAATIGENLGRGSESAFAQRMTRTARSLGMSRTTFKNASGLPNPAQVTTAKDMATLGLRLMRDFPQYYPYFRATSFRYKGRVIQSHNRLVGRFEGTDGIKTGYVNASGYNLVTSTRRDGKRVVGVVLGGKTASRRNSYMMKIISLSLPKAKQGKTLAAVAGSTKGVIDPLKVKATIDVSANDAPAADSDSDQLAALAAQTDINSPQVIQAELQLKKKQKRPVIADETSTASLTTPGTEGFGVQISAFDNKKAAAAAVSDVKAVGGEALEGKKAFTVAVKKDGKIEYRLVIAGLSQKSAKQSCAKLAKAKMMCAVVQPNV